MKALALAVLILALSSGTAWSDGPKVGPEDATDSFVTSMTSQHSGDLSETHSIASASTDGPRIDWIPQCGRRDGITVPSAFGCEDPLACGDGGSMYQVWAVYPDGHREYRGVTCVEPDDPIAAQVITPGAIYRAFKRIPLPKTPLIVQPVGGTTLVNIDTVLHTDATAFTRTVRLLGRRITFDITPSQFTWHLGHGATLTTRDPGRPYQAGLPTSDYVSYRYPTARQESLSLTTTWSARWHTGGGPWRNVDGTVQTNTPTQDLHVTTATPDLISYD